MDIKEELKKVRAAIKALNSQKDLSEDEAKELKELVAKAENLEARKSAQEQEEKAAAEEADRVEREKKAAVDEAVKNERAKQDAITRRLPYSEAPHQAQFASTWRYDNLDGTELSLVIETLKSAGKHVSPDALKAMSLRVAEMKDDNTDEGRKSVQYVKSAFKADTGIDPVLASVEAAIKAATDPMYTGGSLIGSDWVGAAYSTELWRVIRANTLVAARIPSDVIPDGYSSKTWPLESTDPTWYKVAEATASESTLKIPQATITASQAATASKQITVGKMGARVLFTGELTEDSLVQFVPALRSQLQISGAEILESLMIDGDVETSANKNINDIAGTPAATDYFLIVDGFRKLALVTNTANSRSAAAGLTIEDYMETLKLLGTAGLGGADNTKVAFIVDGNVHYANMQLPEVKTREVAGSAATVFNGFLQRAYGVEILPSWQMHRASAARLAQTDGKIDVDTTADNVAGAILAVRFDQWKQAYKRRMTMETTRIANADSWEIVALARWGMAYRDSEASAISYNVGV
jgi:hypothetical protein